MKRIKSLEDFENIDEATPAKVAYRFTISKNLKAAAKIQKTLIDVHQLLTEMSDEIVALKLNYSNLDDESTNILGNMKNNIDNMLIALKKEAESGENTGMVDNVGRLTRNLEKLKKVFLQNRQ